MPEEIQKQTKKRFWKFAIALAAIFVLTLAAFLAQFAPDMWRTWQQQKETQRLVKQIEEQQRREREDTYGGKTPEETYQLFIQALEKQDIDLAVKYFVFDQQDEMGQLLERIKSSGKWEFMFRDLSGYTTERDAKMVAENWYEIVFLNKVGEPVAILEIRKFRDYPIWKISKLWS